MKQLKTLLRKPILIPILLLLWLPNILLAQENQANKIHVTGKVTDNLGNGLPSVNVILKNTQIGVNTDIDGKYKPDNPIKCNEPNFSFFVFGICRKNRIVKQSY